MDQGLLLQIITSYTNYQGSSFYMLYFLCALIFLYFVDEKRAEDGTRNDRILLIYVSIGVLFLFLFPPFAWIITKILGDEIYYRTIWLFPIGIVISYGAVRLIQKQSTKIHKIILTGIIILLIMII